jgi:hypothetical protein
VEEMIREITFSINDIDKIHVSSDTFNGYYTWRRLYAGQSGENEATRLTFVFGSDFEDYDISVQFDGTEVKAYSLTSGDMEFSYDIPVDYMIPEVVKMLIEAEDSDGQIARSRLVYLEVKR